MTAPVIKLPKSFNIKNSQISQQRLGKLCFYFFFNGNKGERKRWLKGAGERIEEDKA